MRKCPGQDMRFWTPEDVKEVACGNCGHPVEFFKTEGRRRCPECGERVTNPAVRTGCARWCEHARKCLGFDPEAVNPGAGQGQSIVERLIEAIKQEPNIPKEHLSRALRVLDHAEALLPEVGGSPSVVFAAALLHDLGTEYGERGELDTDSGSVEGACPVQLREILDALDLEPHVIERVRQIIEDYRSGNQADTPEFCIVWDAHCLVDIEKEEIPGEIESVGEYLQRTFLTDAGRRRARHLLNAGFTA